MKKVVNRIIFVIACSIMSATALCAQGLSNSQKRSMNSHLLELINQFEEYSSLSDNSMQYGFIKLFESQDSKVFCDYISSSDFESKISVKSYVDYTKDHISSLYPAELRSIKKGGYNLIDGFWHIKLSFLRTVEYLDELGTYFSGEYVLTLDCKYLSKSSKFVIVGIDGENISPYLFPSRSFSVIKKENAEDSNITVDGEKLVFNEYNQAFAFSDSFTYPDDDIVLNVKEIGNTGVYSMKSFSITPKHARMRVHFDASPIFAYAVNSPIEFSKQKSSAYEFGVDCGYMWKVSPATKVGVYGGIGLSFSSLSLSKDATQYALQLSDYDPASDLFYTYSRFYNLQSVTEGFSFVDVVLPFSAAYEQALSDKVVMSWDLGVKLYLNTKMTVSPYEVTGTVSNTVTGDLKPFYEGDLNLAPGFLSPVSYARNIYDISWFIKGGVDIRLAPLNYITLKLGFERGFTDSYHSAEHDWYSESSGSYPIFYSKGQDIKIRSFIDCISYRRQSLWFDLGWKLKF